MYNVLRPGIGLILVMSALALATSSQAQIVDVVGSAALSANDQGLAKGNSFEVLQARTLIEIEAELQFSTTQTLRFTVHASPTEFGTYDEVFATAAQVSGTGLAFYSSGPMSLPLVPGEHYIVACSWDGVMDYYFGTGQAQTVSFGEQTHGYAVGLNPLPALFDSNIDDQAIYSQRLTTTGANTNLGTAYCTPAVLNSVGLMGEIAATGSLSVGANNVTLEAANLPPNQFGIFVVGSASAFVANGGGTSNGNICIGGVVGRYNQAGQILATGASGSFALPINLATIPQGNGNVATMPGDTWFFQGWHRDSVGLGSNFTHGLEVTFI